MNGPAIPLKELKELVGADSFTYSSGKQCGQALETYLHGQIESYRPFISRVVLELCDGDFCETVAVGQPPMVADVYGVKLSDDCLDDFDVAIPTWYVKVTLQGSRGGRCAFFLSLHPLAWAMHRVGGVLKAESRR